MKSKQTLLNVTLGCLLAVGISGCAVAEIHVDTTGETYIDGNQVKPSHSGSDYLKFKQETITYTLRKSGASWKDSDAGTSGRILFD